MPRRAGVKTDGDEAGKPDCAARGPSRPAPLCLPGVRLRRPGRDVRAAAARAGRDRGRRRERLRGGAGALARHRQGRPGSARRVRRGHLGRQPPAADDRRGRPDLEAPPVPRPAVHRALPAALVRRRRGAARRPEPLEAAAGSAPGPAGLRAGRPARARLPERHRLGEDAADARPRAAVPAASRARRRAAEQRRAADAERADVGAARARPAGQRPARAAFLQRRGGRPVLADRDHRPEQAGREEGRQAGRRLGLRRRQPGAGRRRTPRRVRQGVARAPEGAVARRVHVRVLRHLQPGDGRQGPRPAARLRQVPAVRLPLPAVPRGRLRQGLRHPATCRAARRTTTPTRTCWAAC